MEYKLFFIAACALLSVGFVLARRRGGLIVVGQLAPQFTLLDQEGNRVSLSDFAGKKVAIYFYPKDNTPGCTKQACSLRDGFFELEKHGIVLLGISRDSQKSHKKFSNTYNLPFILLSDHRGDVVREYGVKWFFGMAKRVTFLVDENGIVVTILKDIDVEAHADQIIDRFSQI